MLAIGLFFDEAGKTATESRAGRRLTGQCKLSQGRFVLRILSCLLILSCVSAATQPATGSPPEVAQQFDLARHRGRVVIVDFWASWCKPCRQSIPWLNSLRARYGAQGLTIIGVNVDAQRRDADRFLRDSPIDFEIVFDPDGDLAKQFAVQGMPSSFVFDRAGTMVDTYVGFREAKKGEHEARLEKLLNRPAP
jgi:thiol-disulfide isomerase/thioredoxin